MAESKSPSGTSLVQSVKRTLLMKKCKEKEAEGNDATASNTNPTSPHTPTSPTKDGFRWTNWSSSFRRLSLQEKFKHVPKPGRTRSCAEMDITDYDCDFTNNIPSAPLSVMEIDKLIESAALKEAYLNIISLQKEVERGNKGLCEEASPVNLTTKVNDLNLLYKNLESQLTEVIHQSCTKPFCKKGLLVQVAAIIQDKQKREGDVGGVGGWRDVWKTGVQQGMRETLGKIHQDKSSVVVHLEFLGKNILQLLEMVKANLLNLYPLSFETYASFCHESVAEHLEILLEKITKLEEYNAMLDFVANQYHGEKIFGSPSLQPEMKDQTFLTFPDDLLGQIRKAYCDCLQENLQASLGNIINYEQEAVWRGKATPKRTEDGNFLISDVYTNVCEMIRKYSDNCSKIDANLEKMATYKCVEALKHFPKRFEEEFSKQNCSLLGSDLLDCCLWAEYHIAYINSFTSLKEHVEGYREKCPEQVEELVKEVDGLIEHLRQALLEQLKVEIKPCLSGLMTKNWLNTDTDFNELVIRIETYSGYSKSMRHPPSQSFANDVHYYVVRGYISELLKNKYSCKGKKNEDAAVKINEQWTDLKKLFCEMGSNLKWLHSLGHQISKIIEQENEKNIKNVLTPLVETYPDISKKQITAILNFRDSGFKFERSPAIRCFTELKRKIDKDKTENYENHDHTFFSDIE